MNLCYDCFVKPKLSLGPLVPIPTELNMLVDSKSDCEKCNEELCEQSVEDLMNEIEFEENLKIFEAATGRRFPR